MFAIFAFATARSSILWRSDKFWSAVLGEGRTFGFFSTFSQISSHESIKPDFAGKRKKSLFIFRGY